MTTRGERIKRQRDRLGLSQLQLYEATGVGLRTIGRIEKDEVKDSPNITKIEDYLGLTDRESPEGRPEQTGSASAQLGGLTATIGDPPSPEVISEAIRYATELELLAELVGRASNRAARGESSVAARGVLSGAVDVGRLADVLSELMAHATNRAHGDRPASRPGPPGRVQWRTEDAPSARRERMEHNARMAQDEEADGRRGEAR